MDTMYTDSQIDAMRTIAESAGLSGHTLLTRNSYDLIRKHCNGIGCKGLPQWVVDLLNHILPSAVVPACIHDLRFHYGDGTNASFLEANRELEANIVAMGYHYYTHWWQFLTRRKLRRIAAIVRGVCDEFGWGAYVRAIEERKAEEEVCNTVVY